MLKYDHKKIEKKWKKYWDKEKIYQTKDDRAKPKYFVLDMFPYPSGAGLHVGHPKGYIATDIVARMKMMQGYNVLHPMGWDAFGLPAENYAIANKMHPAEATEKNIKTFKKQLGLLGFTYDWDREVNTTDPKYYKWTQWAFLQMFKKGLAFESFEPINWCPKCQTGLANEDLEDGKCERCGSEIERKPMRQWVLKITDYAERLLNDLDKLDKWPNPIKEMQRNWIGKSEGATIRFTVIARSEATKQSHSSEEIASASPAARSRNDNLEVFTTRPDTLFGATYMVLAPEHKFISDNLEKIQNKTEVEKYIAEANKKSDLERTDLAKEKTGVELKGIKAINPANGEDLPIFVADYVITGYGTGAIMAVPAHDERDFEFAKKYNLPIKEVLKGGNIKESAFTEDGIHINSDFLNDLDKKKATEKMIQWLEEKGIGRKKIQYKLRDWVFSRQRYWGEPIPLVHCEKCKNRKYRYLLLHGRHESSKDIFFPWLKNILVKKGYEIFSPDLPDTDNPKVEEQADYVMKNFQLDENTIIVGHSLGGPVALNLLERTGKKVKRVVMVDSPIRPEFTDMPRPDLEKNFHWRFDYKKIRKLSSEFVSIIDSNFPIITPDQFKVQEQELGSSLVYAHANSRHFNSPEENVVLEQCLVSGVVPVPEKDLPVELPKVKNYEPSGTGESPLANIEKWVNTKCPHCGGPAKRETNTMPQWAGSCWYYLRYIDPHNDKALVDKEKEKFWSPVDFYVGGAEHATRHLIYARFWHKFLFDIGVVNYDEPFTRLQNLGLILAEDGRKMSKRWGNVINPDDIVAEFGADSMRIYEMFMGPFDQPCAWSTNGLIGARRFVEKVWALQEKLDNAEKKNITTLLHQTIKKVSEDIENMHFNTAISQLMILANEMSKEEKVPKEAFFVFIKLLAPFAPHMAEEIWNALGNSVSVFLQPWPQYDASLAKESEITLAVQINGKLRDTIVVDADISEEEAKQKALASEKVQKWLEGKTPKKVIYVKGKLVSIVI